MSVKIDARRWSVIFGIRQMWVWRPALQGTSPQAPSPVPLAIFFLCFVAGSSLSSPPLSREGVPGCSLLFSSYTHSSGNLWGLQILSLCYDSHLFLEVWEIDFSCPDLFSKLQTHISNCLLAIPLHLLVCWRSHTRTAPKVTPVFPDEARPSHSSHLSWWQRHPFNCSGQDPWNHPWLRPSPTPHIQSISKSF